MQKVTRGRQAAQEQAEMLAAQFVVGFGKDHPIVEMAAELAKQIREANDAE